MENSDVVLEISDACVIVEMEGIRAEVRGPQARDVKHWLARQALETLGRLPSMIEQKRYAEQAMQARAAGPATNDPAFDRINQAGLAHGVLGGRF